MATPMLAIPLGSWHRVPDVCVYTGRPAEIRVRRRFKQVTSVIPIGVLVVRSRVTTVPIPMTRQARLRYRYLPQLLGVVGVLVLLGGIALAPTHTDAAGQVTAGTDGAAFLGICVVLALTAFWACYRGSRRIWVVERGTVVRIRSPHPAFVEAYRHGARAASPLPMAPPPTAQPSPGAPGAPPTSTYEQLYGRRPGGS